MLKILFKLGILLSVFALYFTITIQKDIHMKEVDTLFESRSKLISLFEYNTHHDHLNHLT